MSHAGEIAKAVAANMERGKCDHVVIGWRTKPGRPNEPGWWECVMPDCEYPNHDVTELFGRIVTDDVGVLPLDCPTCGRQRLCIIITDKPGVIVYCEKCGARRWTCDPSVHSGGGGGHPQQADGWVDGMGVG